MCNGDQSAYTIREECMRCGVSEWHRYLNPKGDDCRGQGWKIWGRSRKERGGRKKEGEREREGGRVCVCVCGLWDLFLKAAVSSSVTCCECNHLTSQGLYSPRQNKGEELNCVSTSQWRHFCPLKSILEMWGVGAVLHCLIICTVDSSCVRHPAVSGQSCQTKNCLMSSWL